MKPMTQLTDARVVKALAHPLRVSILAALERRTASPSELADELDAPLGSVSYHVRQLASFGLVKLVKETRRRGAVEHYYRLEARPRVTDEAWSKAPPLVKEALVGAVLSQVSEQVNRAATSGGFERGDSRVSRLPLALDDKGFQAAARELEALTRRLKRIEEQSVERQARNEHQGEVAGLAVLMLFEAVDEGLAAAEPKRGRRTRRAGDVQRG